MDTNTLVVVAVGLTAIVTTIVFCRREAEEEPEQGAVDFDTLHDVLSLGMISHAGYTLKAANIGPNSAIFLQQNGRTVFKWDRDYNGRYSVINPQYATIVEALYRRHLSQTQAAIDDFLFEQASEELK